MLDLPQPLVDAFWNTVQSLMFLAVPAFAVFAVGKLTQLGIELWREFKNDHPSIAWQIEQAADTAVKAAEQQGLTGQLLKFAMSKKEYALKIATEILKANGVKIDLLLIDAMIEAKVLDNFPKKPAAPATDPVP